MSVLRNVFVLAVVCSIFTISAAQPVSAQGFGAGAAYQEAGARNILAYGAGAVGQLSMPTKALNIQLPRTVNPEYVTLLLGIYSQGTEVVRVPTKKGVYKYSIQIPLNAWVNVLAHYPGAKVVAFKYDSSSPSAVKPSILLPEFQSLPMVPVTIKVVDTKGNPIARQNVVIVQDLNVMEYLSGSGPYAGTMECPYGIVLDGKSRGYIGQNACSNTMLTDSEGRIVTKFPSLLDDPYYQSVQPASKRNPGFKISLPIVADVVGFIPTEFYDWFATPEMIPAQRRYDKPVIVTMTYTGGIRVTLSKEFLDKNGITDDEVQQGRVSVMASQQNTSEGYTLSKDGMIEIWNLRPGKYNLTLRVRTEITVGVPFEKSVLIQKDVVVNEREVTKIER